MKVFKFGGASVNSADAVRNMARIVENHLESEPLIVVVSAMGKTTNLLEKLVVNGERLMVNGAGAPQDRVSSLTINQSTLTKNTSLRQQLEDYHLGIAQSLIPDDEVLTGKIRSLLHSLDDTIKKTSPPYPSPGGEGSRMQLLSQVSTPLSSRRGVGGEAANYNYCYDQIVSYGELISTTIIAHYLNHLGINTLWQDAREYIITDNHYREGRVDWEATHRQCQQLKAVAQGHQVVVTQGFIGGTNQGESLKVKGERWVGAVGSASATSHLSPFTSHLTTTLGREGSDYSAAILAHCLGAESITIWKDVPGFLNADPKFFADTVKISQIPYNEAIELAYYGASVIHPKTVKPIQNMGIPLHIRSFITPEAEGSSIGDYRALVPQTPLYIFKNNQILLSILPRDYSFIAEDNLQTIFGILSRIGIRVNLMQNSALSFSICIDNNPQLVEPLIAELKSMFLVRYNAGLQLITIRYYTQQVIDSIVARRPILLEQRSRATVQILVNEKNEGLRMKGVK